MKRLFLLFIFIPFISFSQNNKIDSLLNAIAKLQSGGTGFYKKGMFPSQRGKYKRKEDNSVFFTSLIAFTLQNSKSSFSPENKRLADTVCKTAIANYKYYQNINGTPTYNFWQTNPSQFFPGSGFLSRHKRFCVPDDADCTVLVYLTDTAMGAHVKWLKKKLGEHANLTTDKIRTTFKEYRKLKAYSTWFGKNMPIEFDVCVLSNILYFVYENKLPLNVNDSAGISYIRSMVLSGRYLRQDYYISPSYRKKAIILYHLARLMGKFQIPLLEDCRQIIKNDIELELNKKHSFMERVVLSSAFIRMGGKPEEITYPVSLENEMKKFNFFNANLFAPYERPAFRFLSKWRACVIPFYCKPYSLALLLEYESLKKK